VTVVVGKMVLLPLNVAAIAPRIFRPVEMNIVGNEDFTGDDG